MKRILKHIPDLLQRMFLLLFVFISAFANNADAQVVALTDWTNVYNNTGNYSGSITIPAGTIGKRVLVVGLATTTVAASTRTVSVIYGGQTLTSAGGDISSNTRQHTQFYYLNEAGISNAAGTTLAVTFSGGTSALNSVFWGATDNVDQSNPITDVESYSSVNTNTSTFSFSPGLSLLENDLGIKILSSVRTGSTVPRSISNFATNWEVRDEKTRGANNLGIRHAVGYRTVTTAGTDVSSTTMNNGSLISMTGISLKAYVPPTITVSTNALSGFTYPQGFGPSTQQSFTVSGSNLSSNITVLPTDSFEISLTSGGAFVAQTIITLPVVTTSVSATTIFVRMKAGLDIGSINPISVIRCSSDNAVTKTVACSGTVTNAPTITVNPSTLSGFYYNVNAGPSTAQSFTVSGAYLSSNLVITAPTNYEISTSAGGTYGASLSFTPNGSGTVTSKTIYVRLKSGLLGGVYNENVTLTSTNITQNVACNGSVNSPYITLSTFVLGGFIYTAGAGPSGVQTVTVSGLYLTNNIVLTAPTNFEIKLTSGGTFGSTVTLTRNGSGTVSPTSIDVRMKSGLSSGTIVGPINLSAVSSGAITQNVALSGKVVNTSTNITSSALLTGFVYTFGNGPSVIQSFTVSGTSLTNNIIVTPPTNFEISLSAGGTYVSTPLTINQSAGKVNAQTVYVRLKAGLSIGTYTPVNIAITSSPATAINVSCNGKVIAVPSITAGTTPASPVCEGDVVSLTSTGTAVTNQYWTGPNDFYYSNPATPNPSLGAVTSNNAGTYTVTGSAVSGVNLLTNGDFEDNNTGFGSSYLYTTNIPPEKGAYYIVNKASDFWSGFNTRLPKKGNYQMVIDGATTNGVVAWAQSISVIPGANYQFSYWMQSVYTPPYAKMQLFVNGLAVGDLNTAPNQGDPWQQFTTNVNAGSNSVLQLTLINSNLEANGNDFALDDLVFQQVFTATGAVDLAVNPVLPVSVSIAASANNVTQGTTVTYTATPTNGGTNPAYQWKVNGANVGTNSPTFSYVPNNGDVVTCVLTSNIPCPSGNPATATSITMTVNPATNYWYGTNSEDWGTASNWTANFIPLAGDNVVYATALNNGGSPAIRDLVLDQNRTIGSLINATVRRLVIPAARALTVNNTITVTPPVQVPAIDPANLIYIYADSASANGSLSFNNAQNSPVFATVEFYSKSSWDLTKPINQKYKWQYFGIPVESVKASPTFDGAYVRERNEAGTDTTTHWSQLTNDSFMIPFKGYEICYENPKTTLIKGQLINRNYNSGPLVKSTVPGVLYPGQHLFANPYTAAIDIRQITFGSDVEATVYMYNTGTFSQWGTGISGNRLGNTPGQYTSVPKNMAGSSGIPIQVPSMSSFLVFVSTPTANAYISMNYNNVITKNTDQVRVKSVEDKEVVSTIIDVESKTGGDRMWLFTDKKCTRNFDNGYDARKLSGTALSPQIFAVEQDGNYQINSIDDIDNTTIAFQAGQDTEYTMTFTHENIDALYQKIILYDMVAKTSTDITANGSTYTFSAQSSPKPTNRFKVFTNTEKDKVDSSKFTIFNFGNTLNVYNNGTSEAEIYIFDIAGRKIAQRKIQPNLIRDFQLENQHAYIVKIISNEKTETHKIIIQ